MKISQALRILAQMSDEMHIDEDLFSIFIRSGIWHDYT